MKSFVMLVLGKPGSGKTHLINQLVLDERFFCKRFDRFLYVGPTRYKNIVHEKQNTNSNLDIGWLYEKF